MGREFKRASEAQRTALNAWIASVAGLLIYLLLPWWISAREIGEVEPYRGFRVILWCVAVVQLGVFFWWSRRSVNKEAIMKAGQSTAIDPPAYFMGKKIAAISMAQSIAVYGLVLALIGRYLWDQYILTLISATLLIRHYPHPELFEALERERENERLSNQPKGD